MVKCFAYFYNYRRKNPLNTLPVCQVKLCVICAPDLRWHLYTQLLYCATSLSRLYKSYEKTVQVYRCAAANEVKRARKVEKKERERLASKSRRERQHFQSC